MNKKLTVKERVLQFNISDVEKQLIIKDLYSFGFRGNDNDRHKLIDELYE